MKNPNINNEIQNVIKRAQGVNKMKNLKINDAPRKMSALASELTKLHTEDIDLEREKDFCLDEAADMLYETTNQVDMRNSQNRENLLCAALVMLSSALEMAVCIIKPEFSELGFSPRFVNTLRRLGLVNSSFDNFMARYFEEQARSLQ